MKFTKFIYLPMICLFICAGTAVADTESDIAELKAEIAQLKAQVAELMKVMEPFKAKIIHEERLKKHQQAARKRMGKDQEKYSAEELQEIETMYQVANKNWRTDEAKESLENLILKYREANRTGCAVLYLGQMTTGEDKELYLKRAIESFPDCYYGDGVQVGAYARFYLAHHYAQQGKTEAAKKLVDELKENYPNAIDHRGNLISENYPAL